MHCNKRSLTIEGEDWSIDEYPGTGPSVLCIGGILYAKDDYRAVAIEFQKNNRRVLVTGKPQSKEGESILQFQERLRRGYRKILEDEECRNLIGHSRGTLHAMQVFERLPEGSVDHITLIAIPNIPKKKGFQFGEPRLPQYGRLDHLLAPFCPTMSPSEYQRLVHDHYLAYGADKAWLAEQRNTDGVRVDRRSLSKIFEGYPSDEEFQRVISIINSSRTKILCIGGKEDPLRYEFQGNNNNVRQEPLMEGVGHFVHVEEPVKTVRLILN